MRVARTPAEQPPWFGASSLPPGAATPRRASGQPPGEADSASFARLWTGFMSARVLLALVLVGMSLLLDTNVRVVPGWLAALSLAYLALTVLVRLLARPSGPGRSFDAQWLQTVGIDVAFFITLQVQQSPAINYTPLLALPVLMAAIMGTRALALGTAALVTLVLLGNAAWSAGATSWENTAGIVQVGLTGAGLLVLSLLTNQLSTRLAREEAMVRRSRGETQMQSLVNNLVIEALPDGVLVVDAGYTVRAANPAAHVMLGADQEVTPDRFSLLDNPAWVQLAHVVRLTFADGPIDEVEVALHHEDRHGSHLRARTQRTPSTGDGGGLCVVFLQDLREMEARLRTEKLAAMGRMSAAVAHEIRNPLAAISQANALLEEDLESPTQRRLTAMVRQNAQRLGHIVEDVLDVVRVQGPSEPDTVQALALDEEVQSFCREWRDQGGAGQRLEVEPQAPDIQVRFAREHLRRILVNLLDNAARYASQRAGAIQVSTHAVRHGPVMLMVWSDGPPMEASVRRHLFEPFFSSEARSSGLGLFICRELCERHGAVIGHERTPRAQDGRAVDGNEFFVSFRRAHGAHSILPPEEATRP
ncbi:MAG: histidine kinase dimerization/phospho-acceptor domain-containing protein [Ottowia sp.]|uniref:sensor histidine kinase n=1 Tax=Ottowia sp. TaxID=1898956 RepID=UPI0039E67655